MKLWVGKGPTIASGHKALSAKKFLVPKAITEMEHPLYSSNLAPNDFWLFPKIKYAL
jgi:hypothetical protein